MTKPNTKPCPECGQVHDVPDIEFINDSLPWWPEEQPWWSRILCLLGYHRWEERRGCPKHMGCIDGKPFPLPNMKLRDQCGRCGAGR